MTASSSLPALTPRVNLVALRSLSRRGEQWLVRHAVAILAVTSAFAVFAFRSIYSHLHYQSHSYDLGIFAQGLKGYADGTGPISEIKGLGFSLLGDHFSPITAVLAPVYLLFPSVIVLLVAQAFLIALGVVPLTSWAQRALGRWQAACVALLYTTSFGIASAIGFDFHEVAFAVPLLSFSLCAIGQLRYRFAAACALPLVLVKEDLGVTVAAIGLVLVLRRRGVLGAGLAAFGLAATALEVFVLIPLANPTNSYSYSGQSAGFNLSALIHQQPDVLNVKIATLVTTFSVGIFLSTRSTLVLVAVPTLVWRMIGSNAAYWTTGYQYSLVLMPIIVAAVVEVLVRENRNGASGRRFVRWALPTSVVVGLVVSLSYPLSQPLRASFWGVDPRLSTYERAVDLVPRGATVAATDQLVPHLVDRSTVSLFTDSSISVFHPGWIVADMRQGWPDSPEQRAANVESAEARGYRVTFSQDDVVVLKR